MSSPFGTFTGVQPFEFVSGVHLRAVGGEQVLLCRVNYEAGKIKVRGAVAGGAGCAQNSRFAPNRLPDMTTTLSAQ